MTKGDRIRIHTLACAIKLNPEAKVLIASGTVAGAKESFELLKDLLGFTPKNITLDPK